jgi:hypothetical protein
VNPSRVWATGEAILKRRATAVNKNEGLQGSSLVH